MQKFSLNWLLSIASSFCHECVLNKCIEALRIHESSLLFFLKVIHDLVTRNQRPNMTFELPEGRNYRRNSLGSLAINYRGAV